MKRNRMATARRLVRIGLNGGKICLNKFLRMTHFLLTAVYCAVVYSSVAVSTEQKSSTGVGQSNLTFPERIGLDCRDPQLPGPLTAPTRISPSSDTPFERIYSPNSDFVRLAGSETEAYIALGAGNDIALLYDVGDGMNILADSGADTILLCSMAGLATTITLGTENLADDSDADVVVVDSSVITEVPAGLYRVVSIFSFDQARDKLVIRAPVDLIKSREASPVIGGIRVGNVHFAVFGSGYSQRLDFNSDAFLFKPDERR